MDHNIQYFFGEIENLVQVRLLREKDSSSGNYVEEPVPFTVSRLSNSQMTLDMQFEDPASITDLDKLVLTVNFEEFAANYKHGSKYEAFMKP